MKKLIKGTLTLLLLLYALPLFWCIYNEQRIYFYESYPVATATKTEPIDVNRKMVYITPDNKRYINSLRERGTLPKFIDIIGAILGLIVGLGGFFCFAYYHIVIRKQSANKQRQKKALMLKLLRKWRDFSAKI